MARHIASCCLHLSLSSRSSSRLSICSRARALPSPAAYSSETRKSLIPPELMKRKPRTARNKTTSSPQSLGWRRWGWRGCFLLTPPHGEQIVHKEREENPDEEAQHRGHGDLHLSVWPDWGGRCRGAADHIKPLPGTGEQRLLGLLGCDLERLNLPIQVQEPRKMGSNLVSCIFQCPQSIVGNL